MKKPDILKTFKKLAYAAAATTGVAAGAYLASAFRFPAAQDYMKSKGFDSRLVRQVTDANVRVRTGTFGYLHTAFDPVMSLHRYDPQRAAALDWGVMSKVMGFQLITLPDGGYSFRETFRKNAIPAENVEFDLPPEIVELRTILHELGHTEPRNLKLDTTIEREATADVRMIETISQTLNRPDAIRPLICIRAFEYDASHDVSLYLDAHFNGKPLPTAKQMLDATTTLLATEEKLKSLPTTKDSWFIVHANIPIGLSRLANGTERYYRLLHNGTELSPLVQRRAELYVEGMNIFFPTITSEVMAYIEKYDRQFIKPQPEDRKPTF